MQENLYIKRILFKEIVDGDIRKLNAQSNDANTGGGARDFRFKPQNKFWKFFSKLCSIQDSKGILKDKFHWYIDGQEIITEMEVYSPTKSRPNEIRLSKVNSCIPSAALPQSSGSVIFLISQRSDGQLWPYFITLQSLRNDDWDPALKKVIENALSAHKRKSVSAMGYYDYETKEEYYYEQ